MTEIATWFLFTFHYVSISTFSCALSAFAFLIIYIPLCIYFNALMNYARKHREDIYIPLCIYFNSGVFSASALLIYIYIPLCIYFNESMTDDSSSLSEFTFHYVSISTQIFRSLISIIIIVALLSTKQTSIIFILTCSGNIWIITDKIRIVDLPVILQYYVPTVKA